MLSYWSRFIFLGMVFVSLLMIGTACGDDDDDDDDDVPPTTTATSTGTDQATNSQYIPD